MHTNDLSAVSRNTFMDVWKPLFLTAVDNFLQGNIKMARNKIIIKINLYTIDGTKNDPINKEYYSSNRW